MLKNSKILIFIVFTAIIIGISFFAGNRQATNNMQVLYISQTELLSIEKARIEQEPLKNKQLFFGKPEQAIKYIEQVQKQLSKRGVLVLLADNKIYGSNVRSISKETHSQIIKSLAEGAE